MKRLPEWVAYKDVWLVFRSQDPEAVVQAMVQAGWSPEEVQVRPWGPFCYGKAPGLEELLPGEGERLAALSRDFPQVWYYISHRTASVHGFALAERGELVRAYYTADGDIWNSVGRPLEEERTLGWQLFETTEELLDWPGEWDASHVLDEEGVMALAALQTGIEEEQG